MAANTVGEGMAVAVFVGAAVSVAMGMAVGGWVGTAVLSVTEAAVKVGGRVGTAVGRGTAKLLQLVTINKTSIIKPINFIYPPPK
jgi:hypothetical protein